MLHAEPLALLAISSILTTRPRNELDPTANRDMSSLCLSPNSLLLALT